MSDYHADTPQHIECTSRNARELVAGRTIEWLLNNIWFELSLLPLHRRFSTLFSEVPFSMQECHKVRKFLPVWKITWKNDCPKERCGFGSDS